METLKISPHYLERFSRLQKELERIGARLVSVEGLVEEAVSEYLYEMETAMEITPRVLPVVELEGVRYYKDERLGEYRNVDNPHDRIAF